MAQLGSASALGAEGPRFKSGYPDRIELFILLRLVPLRLPGWFRVFLEGRRAPGLLRASRGDGLASGRVRARGARLARCPGSTAARAREPASAGDPGPRES